MKDATRIIGLDGGLATSGMVVVETNGQEHDVVAVESFATIPSIKARYDHEVADDRVRRAKEYTRWIESLARFGAAAWAIETMGFPKGHNTAVLIALGWGVLSSYLERHSVTHVTAGALVWRRSLVEGGKEDAAHRVAVRRVPSFIARSSGIDRHMLPHVHDALGVFCWSLSTTTIREVLL